MIKVDNIINLDTNISYNLQNSRCVCHTTCASPCKYTLYLTGKKIKIYGIFCNFIVPEIKFYCNKRPCRKYFLLSHSYKIRESKCDFIMVNGQKVFKLGQTFILCEVIFFMNQHCIKTNYGTIGRIRTMLFTNFLCRARTIMFNSKCNQISDSTLRSVINQAIPTYKRLCVLYDWLWINNWSINCSLVLNIFIYIFI